MVLSSVVALAITVGFVTQVHADEIQIISAVVAGDVDTVRQEIENGNVNQTNSNRMTALIVAAKYGNKDICGLLLQNGADIDAVNGYGYTALMAATIGGHKEIVHYLLIFRANIELREHQNQTALDIAKNHNNAEVISMLENHECLAGARFSKTKSARNVALKKAS